MNITILYAWEKLRLAVRALAALPDPIKERLALAYIHNLSHLDLDHVPEAIKSRFFRVHDKTTQAEATGDEQRIRASVNAMSEAEASHLAEEIVSMCDVLTLLSVRSLGQCSGRRGREAPGSVQAHLSV